MDIITNPFGWLFVFLFVAVGVFCMCGFGYLMHRCGCCCKCCYKSVPQDATLIPRNEDNSSLREIV